MPKYAKRVSNMNSTAVYMRGLFGGMTNPNIISFGGGAPAKDALPVDIVRKLANEIFTSESRGIDALQYSDPAGLKDLRQVVVDYLLAPKGLTDITVDNVNIVSGGLETMNLVCQVFIDPGDVILIEDPTFIHCVETFDMFEAKCIPCKCDDIGLIMEDVEAKIKEYNPKIVYTIPTFHNPTGKTLTVDRRKKLAELGSKYDVIILEDDPYKDIRYSGEDVPAIKSFDKTGHTIMAGSFSKIFSPGSRLGYTVVTGEVRQLLVDAKIATNSQPSGVAQVLCAEFFKRGYYEDHLKKICDIYREHRDAMIEGIDKYFPAGTKHTLPDGGYYVWVELPEQLDAQALLPEVNKLNITYLAGDNWFSVKGAHKNTIRMGLASQTTENITKCMKILGDFFTSKME